MTTKFDKEELEILRSIDKKEWNSVEKLEESMVDYKTLASEFLKKEKRINIRISERDLIEIQKKAAKDGLPYQTLISSILHKFVTGRFIERTA